MKAKECQACRGSGWIFSEENGIERVRVCNCRKLESFLAGSERANIPVRFSGVELKSFFPDQEQPSQNKVLQAASDFVRDYPAVSGGLLLQGPTGTGKTRILCSMANELLKKGFSDLLYFDWNDLVRDSRGSEDAAGRRDFNYFFSLFQRLAEVELLILDELGSARLTPWLEENLFFLVNRRYNNNRITLFASNFFDERLNNEELLVERIGARARSRIYEMTRVLVVQGFDYRQRYR